MLCANASCPSGVGWNGAELESPSGFVLTDGPNTQGSELHQRCCEKLLGAGTTTTLGNRAPTSRMVRFSALSPHSRYCISLFVRVTPSRRFGLMSMQLE